MWELDHKEGWAPKNRCFWTVVLEKTLESPLDCNEIKLINTNGNQSWLFTGGTYVEAEALTFWPPDLSHWKSLWCWERLKAGGERNDRGWDGWMASPTQWKWVWENNGSWWWTGRPGALHSMRSQSVGHVWASELKDYDSAKWQIIRVKKSFYLNEWLSKITSYSDLFLTAQTSFQTELGDSFWILVRKKKKKKE